MKRLSPRATRWAVFVAVGLALNVTDGLAGWLFSWHRPFWLSFVAGMAYGLFASAAASHWEQTAEDRAKASAGDSP